MITMHAIINSQLCHDNQLSSVRNVLDIFTWINCYKGKVTNMSDLVP